MRATKQQQGQYQRSDIPTLVYCFPAPERGLSNAPARAAVAKCWSPATKISKIVRKNYDHSVCVVTVHNLWDN